MKKVPYILLIVLLACLSSSALAQKTDYNWVFGWGWRHWLPPDSLHDLTFLDFNSEPLTLSTHPAGIQMHGCNVSVSDADGQLLFYTNGQLILNRQHTELQGSTGYNAHRHHNNDPRDGLNPNQTMIALPDPADSLSYYLIYSKMDFEAAWPDIAWLGMQYSRIDMRGDHGLGEMVEKQVSLIPDSVLFSRSGLTATKHANGRDWWIIQPLLNTNQYVRVLLSDTGLHVLGIQSVGTPTLNGLSGATFSPDGNWYVRNNMLGHSVDPDYLDIYNFDRCTGLLSDHVRFAYGYNEGSGGGVAISPNNRYLYVPHSRFTYQYDLWSDDIEASKDTVAIYDGWVDSLGNRVKFYRVQLAPDGRMYLNSAPASYQQHIIYQPDKHGAACEFVQRAIVFPTINFWSMVNFPSYRLGPIDGSVCDTLGIDNVPLAGYRFDRDTTAALRVRFSDNSWYEPESYTWLIDGMEVSQDTHLVYDFPSVGTYEVCHTAHNAYGDDTLCRDVTITEAFLSVGPELAHRHDDIVTIYPNPTTDFLYLQHDSRTTVSSVTVHSLNGSLLQQFQDYQGQGIDVRTYTPGIYLIGIAYARGEEEGMVYRRVVVR